MSQRSKKTDIVPLAEKGSLLGLLDHIYAYGFRLKSGGHDSVTVMEEQDVPVTVKVEETYRDLEDRHGVKTRVAKVR